jgi:hypothetical protein
MVCLGGKEMECIYWNKNDSSFVIKRGKERYIFSYGVLVAKCKFDGAEISKEVLYEKWNFSKTTKTAVCWFLKKEAKQLKKEIKEGKIKVRGYLK